MMTYRHDLIDRKSPLPLYYQLKKLILDSIESGHYTPGQRIPTEVQLQDTYGLSRTTVRQAIDELINDGVLSRQHGIGTFVAEPKLEQALGRLTGFTEDIRRQGHRPGSRLLTIERIQPSKSVMAALGLSEGEEVIEICRLRSVDDEPVGLHTSYLPALPELVVSTLEAALDQGASLYELLTAKGVALVEAYETLEAVAANKTESELLHVSPRAPLLLIRRTVYASGKVPVELAKMVYRADKYRYTVHLSR